MSIATLPGAAAEAPATHPRTSTSSSAPIAAATKGKGHAAVAAAVSNPVSSFAKILGKPAQASTSPAASSRRSIAKTMTQLVVPRSVVNVGIRVTISAVAAFLATCGVVDAKAFIATAHFTLARYRQRVTSLVGAGPRRVLARARNRIRSL